MVLTFASVVKFLWCGLMGSFSCCFGFIKIELVNLLNIEFESFGSPSSTYVTESNPSTSKVKFIIFRQLSSYVNRTVKCAMYCGCKR